MKILGPLIFAGLILLGIFTFANWTALSTPTSLSFVAFGLEAPLGFVLLGAIAVFVALFTAYVLILRTAMVMDAHRYAKELQVQQQLAEKAEASRLSDLRRQLDHEFAQLQQASEERHAVLDSRIEGMQEALLGAIEESNRSLSAYVGEVEDKLDRNLAIPQLDRPA